jgi:hypothetical protein
MAADHVFYGRIFAKFSRFQAVFRDSKTPLNIGLDSQLTITSTRGGRFGDTPLQNCS